MWWDSRDPRSTKMEGRRGHGSGGGRGGSGSGPPPPHPGQLQDSTKEMQPCAPRMLSGNRGHWNRACWSEHRQNCLRLRLVGWGRNTMTVQGVAAPWRQHRWQAAATHSRNSVEWECACKCVHTGVHAGIVQYPCVGVCVHMDFIHVSVCMHTDAHV